MKEKRVWKFFSIAEQEKEQAFLRQMHRAGWKLVRVGGLCVYHFVPCEPEDVVYQLDYNPEGRAHRAEYLQMFRDCGWEYLQDYLGYAYFRKPAAAMRGEEEEIFSDEASRLQMLRHVFRWRVIPLGLLLLLALVALYVRSIMTRPLLKRVIRTACVASILCLPVAIVQLALSGDPSFRAPATFENPNYYAAILEFVFLVCVNQLMMPGSRGEKLLYSMTLAANLVSLYICNCRSSRMVVMIVTPVLLLIHRRYRWAAVDLVASLAVMLLLKVEPGLFQRMEESGHDFLVRQSIWENALKGFLETPLLGRGPLGYIELARTQGLTFRVHAHNVALDLLLNYGLMGASLLAVYFSGVGKTLWMLLKTKADNHLCAMALGLVAAVAVHGVADVTIFSLQVGLLFALLIGCTGVYERDWVGQRAYRFLL